MKPHEQNLEVDERGDVWVAGKPGAWRHQMPSGHACTQEEVVEYGKLFAAAPRMVRVLLDHLKRHGESMTCGCWTCSDARRVLTSAGVPIR